MNEGLLYACHFMNSVMQVFARVYQYTLQYLLVFRTGSTNPI